MDNGELNYSLIEWVVSEIKIIVKEVFEKIIDNV